MRLQRGYPCGKLIRLFLEDTKIGQFLEKTKVCLLCTRLCVPPVECGDARGGVHTGANHRVWVGAVGPQRVPRLDLGGDRPADSRRTLGGRV